MRRSTFESQLAQHCFVSVLRALQSVPTNGQTRFHRPRLTSLSGFEIADSCDVVAGFLADAGGGRLRERGGGQVSAQVTSPITTYFRVCDGVRVRYADTKA